jgi:hypothetical protein
MKLKIISIVVVFKAKGHDNFIYFKLAKINPLTHKKTKTAKKKYLTFS